MPETQRRKTVTVKIGHVRVGSEAPVVVQSMTNTDTADVPQPSSRSPSSSQPDPSSCGSR